eukprot:6068486-Prymnesium_polylepis.1
MRPWARAARLTTIKTSRSRKTPPALKVGFYRDRLPQTGGRWGGGAPQGPKSKNRNVGQTKHD